MAVISWDNIFTRKRVAITISVIAALFVFLSGMTQPVIPPTLSFHLRYFNHIASSKKGTAIITEGDKLVLFLGPDGKLLNIVDMKTAGTPFDEAHQLAMTDEGVCIAGHNSLDDGFTIKNEGVALYSFDGKFQHMLYEESHITDNLPSPDNRVTAPTFHTLISKNNTLTLLKLQPYSLTRIVLQPEISKRRFSLKEADTFSEVIPLGDAGDLLLYSQTGWYYHFNSKPGKFAELPNKQAYKLYIKAMNLPANAINLFEKGFNPSELQLTYADGKHDALYYRDKSFQLKKYSLTDGSIKHITEIPLSNSLLLKTALFWLAVIYLTLLILYALFQGIKKVYKNEDFRHGATVFGCILLLAGGITAYYTGQIVEIRREQYNHAVINEISQLKIILTRFYKPVFARMEAQGAETFFADPANEQGIRDIQQIVTDFMNTDTLDNAFAAIISIKGHDKNYYALSDSSNSTKIRSLTYRCDNPRIYADNCLPGILYRVEDESGFYQNSVSLFYGSDGTPYAALDLFYAESALKTLQWQFAVECFVNLLAILTVLYLAFCSWQIFRSNFSNYRTARCNGEADAPMQLYSFCCFLWNHADRVDSIVVIFVILKLCQTSGIMETALYTALALSSTHAGELCGMLLLPLLHHYISHRQLGIISAFLSLVCFALIGGAIAVSSIWFYLGTLFLTGVVFRGILYNWLEGLPMAFRDEQRFDIIYNSRTAMDVSSIVAVLLGAYINHAFGFAAVYLYAAAVVTLLGVILQRTFHNTELSEIITEDIAAAASQKQQSVWRIFLMPAGIYCILCMTIPMHCGLQFADYLYPLLAAGRNISPVMVTNCAVFAQTIAIILSDPITQLKKDLGTIGALFFSIAVLSFAFCMCLANSNIYWLTLCMLFSVLVYNRSDFLMLMPEVAERYDYDPHKALLSYKMLDKLINISIPLIFSTIIGNLGASLGISLVGIYCFAAAAAIVFRYQQIKHYL